MSESITDERVQQMYREIEKENEEVRQREDCEVCGDDVPDEDFSWKFAAAGGVLTGPFCSNDCYWRFFTDE